MSSTTVTFYKDDSYTGKSRAFTGAQTVSNLDDVHWDPSSNRDDMKDDISSMTTGPQAWVRLYSKASYGGRTVLVGPDTSVPDMKKLYDENGTDDMDDTVESFEVFDHKPEVSTSNITDNFLALYPGATSGRLNNLYNIELYSQDSQYRIYYPTLTLEDSILRVQINLDHIQAESDDHTTITFSMDLRGGFVDAISVSYEMADETQIPDWVITLTDGLIEVAADAAKVIADGAEIVLTDKVGVIATVETNEVIDLTAEALTFAVDHLDTFRTQLGGGAWQDDKHTRYTMLTQGGCSVRAYDPDRSMLCARGGIIASVKIDAVTGIQKDDHIVLQAVTAPDGRLFSVVGSFDIFQRSQPDDYSSPSSAQSPRPSPSSLCPMPSPPTKRSPPPASRPPSIQRRTLSSVAASATLATQTPCGV
jgi:hypothetical protein